MMSKIQQKLEHYDDGDDETKRTMNNGDGRQTNNHLWVSTTAPTRRSQHNPAKLKMQSVLVTKNTE